VGFRARLNASSSLAETVAVYKELVGVLQENGLLPQGMSRREAERLVLGPYQSSRGLQVSQRLARFMSNSSIDLSNNNCLVAGISKKTEYMGLLPMSVLLGSLGVLEFAAYCRVLYLGYNLGRIFLLLFWVSFVLGLMGLGGGIMLKALTRLIPVAGAGVVCLGGSKWNGAWSYPVPASGWITSYGGNGKQNWTGDFYGNITVIPYLWNVINFPGIMGFTGLKISRVFFSDFYLGHAWMVKLSRAQPMIP